MSLLVPAALAAFALLAQPDLDTVTLRDGGRLRGTVVEETRQSGVTIQLPDGRLEKFAPDQVSRVQYGDGSLGVLGAPVRPGGPSAAPAAGQPRPAPGEGPAASERAVPPAAPPAGQSDLGPPPPPAGQPPPPPAELKPPPPAPDLGPPSPPVPPRPPDSGWQPILGPQPRLLAWPPSLFMLSAGAGLAAPFGQAESGIDMSDLVAPQFLLELEVGIRVTPALTLSVLVDVGVGEAGSAAKAYCERGSGDRSCAGVSAHFAFQLRYAFAPSAPATPWVALGVGSEAAGVSASRSDGQVMYSGVEFPRLGVGYDFRTHPNLGWGVFGTLTVARYSKVRDSGTDYDLQSRATHGWFQVGIRAILGP